MLTVRVVAGSRLNFSHASSQEPSSAIFGALNNLICGSQPTISLPYPNRCSNLAHVHDCTTKMTAPSFSSFPPSFSSFPDLDSATTPKQHDAQLPERSNLDKVKKDRKRRERSNERPERDKKSRRHREDKKHERRTREYSPVVSHEELREQQPSTSQLKNHIFYSDRKGDPSNVQYGSLHKGDVSKYRLVGGMSS